MPGVTSHSGSQFVCPLLLCAVILAQTHAATPASGPAAVVDEQVALNFPDNVELKSLVEYVSDRLGINILYDEQIVNQRLTLKTPAEIPKSSLLELLQSALKMKGLVLVDGDQRGWKKIVAAGNLVQMARSATQPVSPSAAGEGAFSTPMTQVFSLQFGDVSKADTLIKPFLTQPGGNSLALTDQRLLIVTDFQSNLGRVSELVRLIDQPQRTVDVRFISLQNVDASQLASQATQLLAAKLKQRNGGGSSIPDTIDVIPEPRTNRLALIGPKELVGEAEALVRQLDVSVQLTTKFYPLKAASPDRIDRLARELVKPSDLGKVYQSVIDKESNLLIVTGTPEMQRQIASLISNLDVVTPAEQSPVRFYKLTNATAADVLETIGALAGESTITFGASAYAPGNSGTNSTSSGPSLSGNIISGYGGNSGTPSSSLQQPQLPQPLFPGGNRPPAAPGQAPLPPPVYRNSADQTQSYGATSTNGLTGNAGQTPAAATTDSSDANQPRQTVKTKDATVTADPNTNTIIVVASPSVQNFYEQMIKSLDKRRPQVMVECTIVTLDTSNDVSLGIELGGDTRTGNANLVTFSSLGLSTPNPSTGQLAIIPGTGFNAALLKPDVGSMIIRALASSGRSQVFSAPRILVNDNATGTLSSVAESPFTSVNASQTVSTTSFAGYASAGTTITLTPHISEADHLNLEYSVSLNSFTGQGSQGIPPPRQTDSVTSKVTIPDGDIIVVGGLNRKNLSQSQNGIPVLRQIPLLRYLFSSNQKNDESTTLFVFIRPVILRDDQFQDLKYYSQRDARTAGIKGDLPQSEPMLVE